MGEVKDNTFVLPNKKVTIKFIPRQVGIAASVDKNHVISGGMLEGSVKEFFAPMTRSGGIKNVLTDEEKAFFETSVLQGQNLSAYGPFWKTYSVKLEKGGGILDLSSPEDYLKYKLLLAWDSVIAPSLKEYNKSKLPSYQFYMEEEGENMQIKGRELEETKKAWKNFNKIEDDQSTLAAVLYIMSGKKVSANAKLTYLNTEVSNIVDNKPTEFNRLVEDVLFSTKVFAANLERAGLIVKTKDGYTTIDGLNITEKGKIANLDSVVSFLLDTANNEIKELLESRLDNIKE